MDLIHNSKIDFFIPTEIKSKNLREQYEYIAKFHQRYPNIPLDSTAVFGPYPQPLSPWDISEEEKIVIYNKEVHTVLNWVTTKIILNLSRLDYKTLGVLIRIATGMLNKCNISKNIQIQLQMNMVENLKKESVKITLSDLPF